MIRAREGEEGERQAGGGKGVRIRRGERERPKSEIARGVYCLLPIRILKNGRRKDGNSRYERRRRKGQSCSNWKEASDGHSK